MDQAQSGSSRTLIAIIIIAVSLRLVAVIFSQGYMAHDDHFETVNIAYSWQNHGLFLDDGTLRWEGKPDGGILRPATYNLFLFGLMEVTSAIGIEQLSHHMYFDRLVHALLSLLPVLFGYRYLRETCNETTAKWGGLLLACYFLMPFLAVRNLVEMVSANMLLPGLYFTYRATKARSWGLALVAGVLCGLATMLRYQTAAAVVAVPIAIIVVSKQWRTAVLFSIGAALMMLTQAVIDIYTHGHFWGSFVNILSATGPTAVSGPWYRYILLLLGILIPPTSLVVLMSICRKPVIRKHLIMWLPAFTFILVHSFIEEKQERFLIPVLPVILVLVAIGGFYLYRDANWFRQRSWLRRTLIIWFALVNFIALPIFAVNYGKRGLVESMNYLSEQTDTEKVLFLSPERHTFFPYSYWSSNRSGAVTLQSREAILDSLAETSFVKSLPPYLVVVTDDSLDVYLSWLREAGSNYNPVFYAGPSVVDLIAHKLNPKYNRRNESWVLERIRKRN